MTAAVLLLVMAAWSGTMRASTTAMAAGIKQPRYVESERQGKLRFEQSDNATLFHYYHLETGKRIAGFVDQSAGIVSIQGLILSIEAGGKGEGRTVTAKWGGHDIILPSVAAVEADPALLLEFQTLASEWARSVDPQALEGFRLAMSDYVTAAAGDNELTKQASCGWEVAQLVGVSLLATAACSSLFGCLGGFIAFMVQINDTADACNWCGFGRACW